MEREERREEEKRRRRDEEKKRDNQRLYWELTDTLRDDPVPSSVCSLLFFFSSCFFFYSVIRKHKETQTTARGRKKQKRHGNEKEIIVKQSVSFLFAFCSLLFFFFFFFPLSPRRRLTAYTYTYDRKDMYSGSENCRSSKGQRRSCPLSLFLLPLCPSLSLSLSSLRSVSLYVRLSFLLSSSFLRVSRCNGHNVLPTYVYLAEVPIVAKKAVGDRELLFSFRCLFFSDVALSVCGVLFVFVSPRYPALNT